MRQLQTLKQINKIESDHFFDYKNMKKTLAVALICLSTPLFASNIIRTDAPIPLLSGVGDKAPSQKTIHIRSLIADSAKILADGKSSTLLHATLVDDKGASVGAGVPVIWWATMGTVSTTQSVTDSSGIATITLTSFNYPSTGRVTAQAGNNEQLSTEVEFTNKTGSGNTLPEDAILVNQTASSWSFPADGTSLVTLAVSLSDPYGKPLIAGLDVSWETTAGTLSGSVSQTKGDGSAVITLKAPASPSVITVTAAGKWTFQLQAW